MVELAMLSVFLFILAIGGFVADYIFQHIKPLQLSHTSNLFSVTSTVFL